MNNLGTIFIPDISGFTEFVTQTEIQHSNHIISELIEVILNSNELNFTVSEIEGDAVLFYRMGSPPSLKEIINQSKITFQNFHSLLKVIQRDSVCQCGACKTAPNLTLKFVTNFGELSEVQVQNFNKIMGSDVILTHRLLKNNIESREYLLLTKKFLDSQTGTVDINENWIQLKKYSEKIESFGKVDTEYIGLSQLRETIKIAPKKKLKESEKTNWAFTISINAPILLVHQLLADNKTKIHWVPGLKEVIDDSNINRINESHTCVFKDLEIHLVTKEQTVKNSEITYSEEGSTSFGFSFINDFKLNAVDDYTHLSFRIIPSNSTNGNSHFFKSLFNRIKSKIIIKAAAKNQKKSLLLFKQYCEKIAREKAV